MKERRIEMTCPHCGHVFQIKRDTLAIAGISENIEKALAKKTYFLHQCSKCYGMFEMVYPFMFYEPKKHTILFLGKKEWLSNLKDEIVICHSKPEQFLFSYQVLSKGLNLAYVLKKKKIWENKWNARIEFESYDQEHHCLWILVNQEPKAILLSKEEEIELTS